MSSSIFFAALVPITEALGGISPGSIASITDFVTHYTRELAHLLSSNAGVFAYITACEERLAAHDSESAPWDELLQVALDRSVYSSARKMRNWAADRRMRQLESILRDLRRDVSVYLRGQQSAAEAGSQLAAAVNPPQHATAFVASHPTHQPEDKEASSSVHVKSSPRCDGYPPSSAESSGPLTPPGGYSAPPPTAFPTKPPDDPSRYSAFPSDAVPASFSESGNRRRECYVVSILEDRQRRIAAGHLLHLDLRGNEGCPPDRLPSVEMLRDIAPRLLSFTTDLPFFAGFSVEPHAIRPRLFPSLEYLALDMGHADFWTERRATMTVAVLQADLVPHVRFDNATSEEVFLCGDLVELVQTCILIHDSETRHIVFIDRRGFRRSVSGEFINAVPFIFDVAFFSSITDLTLCESMPKHELKLLFACFPHSLEHLRLWFAGFPSFDGLQCGVMTWRENGWGCCSNLRRLTLTGKSPVEQTEESRLHEFALALERSCVDKFLAHIHGRQSAAYIRTNVIAEGGVRLNLMHN